MFFKIVKINLMFCFLNLYFNTAGAIIYIGREIVNDNIFDELRKTKDTKIFSIDEIIDFVYSLPQFYGLKKPIKDKDLYYSIENDEDKLILCKYYTIKELVDNMLMNSEYKNFVNSNLQIPIDGSNMIIYEKKYYYNYTKFNNEFVELIIDKYGDELFDIFKNYGIGYKGKNDIGGFILNDMSNLKFSKTKINSKNIENVKKIYKPIQFVLLKYNNNPFVELAEGINENLMKEIEDYISNLNKEYSEEFFDFDDIVSNTGVFYGEKILKKYAKYIHFLYIRDNVVYLDYNRKIHKYYLGYFDNPIPREYFCEQNNFTADTYILEANKLDILQLLYLLYREFNIDVDIFDIYEGSKKCDRSEIAKPDNYILKIKDEFLENGKFKKLKKDELYKYKVEFYKNKYNIYFLEANIYENESKEKYINLIPK